MNIWLLLSGLMLDGKCNQMKVGYKYKVFFMEIYVQNAVGVYYFCFYQLHEGLTKKIHTS